jgi:hypothetical protein
MIPEFDENGNLPPGIHEATFEEVVARFSLPKSRKRASRTQKLRAFYSFIRLYAVQLYVDGSYTTSKPSPNDVDLVVFLPKRLRFRVEGRPKAFQVHQREAGLPFAYYLRADRVSNGREGFAGSSNLFSEEYSL